LYSSDSYSNMMSETVPEILRTHLTNTVLYLKVLGIADVLSFDFLDPPSESQMVEALVLLHQLGAIDDAGRVTAVGQAMSSLPLEPSLSRSIVAAMDESNMDQDDCVDCLVTIAAMLSVDAQSIFVESKGSSRYEGTSLAANARSKSRNDEMERVQDQLRLPYGDHMTYWHVFVRWQCEGQGGKQWCEDNFVNFRSLSTAMKIR
jgi:ATP-dependent RNA helicase DHX8/PRP22